MDQQQSTTLERGKDGFLIRGAEMTRLETFVDAAFAFTVTLIVIGEGDSIPGSYEDFLDAMTRIPAFLACFANIMFFWYAHYRWSRRYGLEDVPSTLLSLALVFVVLVYIYPLIALYSGAISFFSGESLPSLFPLSSALDLRVLFVIFGIGYAAMSLIVALLDAHALRLAEPLGLSRKERFDTVSAILSWFVGIGIAAGSILIAVMAPDNLVFTAGMFYASFGIAMPVLSITRARQWDKLETS